MMSALRWAAPVQMLLAAVIHSSFSLGSDDLYSLVARLPGGSETVESILLWGTLLSLTVLVLLSPHGESKITGKVLGCVLLLMSLIAMLPSLPMQIVHPRYMQSKVPLFWFVINLDLLAVFAVSGIGFLLNKNWSALIVLVGVVLLGALWRQESAIESRVASIKSKTSQSLDSSQVRVRTTPSRVGVPREHFHRKGWVPFAQHMNSRPYVLALFVIALVHTARGWFITRWTGQQLSGTSPQVT